MVGVKKAQCESCGRVWEISVCRDLAHGYLCPDCEDRMMLRWRRTASGVWTDEGDGKSEQESDAGRGADALDAAPAD